MLARAPRIHEINRLFSTVVLERNEQTSTATMLFGISDDARVQKFMIHVGILAVED